ncbi:MAG: methyl-accepting chemotaxis protein [Clostridiales Family XIII bacterium]|jgi:methyl-accepting chemotaxis protein|nr:methyl-accepting chemotaxis protein [Clostridiales Family XIII bacterium]
MKNLKISMKLIVGFGVIVLLTLAMGIISISFTDRIEKNYTELIDQNAKSTSALSLVRSSLYGERSELRALMIYVLRGDSAGAQKTMEAYRAVKAKTESSMEEFATTLKTEEGRSLFARFGNEYKEYNSAVDTFMSAVNAAADHEYLYSTLQTCADKVEVTIATVSDMTVSQFNNTLKNSDSLTLNSDISIWATIGILIAVVLISVCLAIYISSLITKPLAIMKDLLTQVGETGDLAFNETQLREIREEALFKDEIAQSIEAFVKMIEQFAYYGSCLREVANRDLTVKVRTLSDKDTCGIALKNMLSNLNSIFGEISMSASQVASGSSQIAQASTNLATGAGAQAATIEEFTATVTEVHRMADENTRMATEVLQDVHESGRMMNECTSEMDHMLRAMQDINEKSQHISNVIKVIDEIAFQTNILALNAAVEAARAGQHGKGFAVVSDEVRNLASKSAGAAKETAELIESSLRSVSEGNTIVAKVNDSLQAVGAISDRNAASVEKLYSGSTQQSGSMAEINTAITQLSAVVQANSATAEETAASSEEMSAQSVTLNSIVSRFKVDRNAGAQSAPQTPSHAEPDTARDAPEGRDSVISLYGNDKY